MKIYALLLFIAVIMIQTTSSVNPFHVLEIEQGATQQQIRQQYKKLKKHAKDNQTKLKQLKNAYQQIMLDSTLEMTLPKQVKKASQKQNRRNRRSRRGLPRLSDMFRHDYFTGQKNQPSPKSASQRAFEIQDEQNLAQQHKKQGINHPQLSGNNSNYLTNQTIQRALKDQSVTFNIKAARFILFLGGLLLKLTPCFCLYMIYKYRRQNPRQEEADNNPFVKALNGWTGRGRRIGGGKKMK